MPDDLDPQVKEFASQLRRLVDRSGLNIAAVADRTGYSKTSWERYLSGRLLAPKGAIVALAEVTNTNPVHLTTMWELAERAWSRSEMRHDMTMEAIRISQARAALGEFGAPAADTKNGSGKNGRAARSATVTPGIAGPAGVSPTVPPQPTPETRDSVGDVRAGAARGGVSGGSASSASSLGSVSSASSASSASAEANSWGMAGYQGPAARSGAGGRTATPPSGSPGYPGGTPWTPGTPVPGSGGAPQDAGPGGSGGPSGSGGPGGSGGSRRKRRLTMFLAGVVGASVVVAGALFFTNQGDDTPVASKPSPSPTTSAGTDPDLPVGVECSGDTCTGQDPENMGCGGELAQTANSVTVGTTLVEVRYSKTCQAAWARITQAAPGDQVDVTASGGAKQTGAVDTDTDAYTPMVAVKDAGDATACVTLATTGEKGCTQ
ncbi:XRE family transcriptional regulator [Streptomyces sp. NPDC000878]